jgi:Zn finger protein HypA/HybF involved in hydrogenase expression
MAEKNSKKYVKEVLKELGYILISDYEGTKKSIIFKDKEGYKYSLTFDAFLTSRRKKVHPSKFSKRNIFTIENIKMWINKNKKSFILNENNVFISASKRNLVFNCLNCHKDFSTAWNDVQQGRICPYCTIHNAHINHRISLEKVQSIFDEMTVSPLDINQFSGYEKKMDVMCDICGYIWSSKFGNIKYGYACPKCKSSKGEKRIESFLIENKIRYTPQKSFEECKYDKRLRFDFYIPSLNILIEYNGGQHYFPVDFSYSGNEKKANTSFEKIRARDRIKLDYCKSNSIKLLIISYKDYMNIEKILNKEILTKNKIGG